MNDKQLNFVINELHVRMPLCVGYTIDLLAIFNNLVMDTKYFFAQLYTKNDYPVAKIYRDIATESNMRWIISWLRASDNQHKINVADDTTFTKLLVKVKSDNDHRLANSVYATIELFPDATIYYRLYARTLSNITANDFDTFINNQLNTFIDMIVNWNIFLLPTNLYTTVPQKELTRFDHDLFLEHIVYMNIIIPDHWRSLTGELCTNDTLLQLHNVLVSNARYLVNTYRFLTTRTLYQKHILGIFLHDIGKVNEHHEEYVLSIMRILRKAKINYDRWRQLLLNEPLMYLVAAYGNIFDAVNDLWSKRSYQSQVLSDDTVVQSIVNLFGTTVNIMVNNITMLGVTSILSSRVMTNSITDILHSFLEQRLTGDPNYTPQNDTTKEEIQNIDIDFDALLDAIDKDPDIPVVVQNEQTGPTDEDIQNYTELTKDAFQVKDAYMHSVYYSDAAYADLVSLKNHLFYYEEEQMDKDTTDRQAALAHLKEFIPAITGNRKYAQECQSDKKPVFLTIDEYLEYRNIVDTAVMDARNRNSFLTPFGNYLKTVIDNALEWNSDMQLFRFICCMAFDFYTRKILNPYCLYMDMGDGKQLQAVYYIHFKSADDLVYTGRWVPHIDKPEGRYNPSRIVDYEGNKWFLDDDNTYVLMSRVYPNVTRFHCVDFNSSKNYTELPYKFTPDIVQATGMPCCFSKELKSPVSAANYNSILASSHNIYRSSITAFNDNWTPSMFDEVNRLIELPTTLNILFNNTTTSYKGKLPSNLYVRRVVFNGSFVSLFDFIFLMNTRTPMLIHHSRNYSMITNKRGDKTMYHAIYWFLKNFPAVYDTLRNGLIRHVYPTIDDFLTHVYYHYWNLTEDDLWDVVSTLFDINIFVIEQVDDTYRFKYPEGYNVDKLFGHLNSMFVFKYKNKRDEVVYDLIDHITDAHRKNSTVMVNTDVFDAIMPGNQNTHTVSPFVQEIIDMIRSTEISRTVETAPVPTAQEIIDLVGNQINIVEQYVTNNPNDEIYGDLQYTKALVLAVSGKTYILPVTPLSYIHGIHAIDSKYMDIPSKTDADFIMQYINSLAGKPLYEPSRYIVMESDPNSIIGYTFSNNVNFLFEKVERGIIEPNDINYRLATLFFEPGTGRNNNELIENFLVRQTNAQSYVLSMESMLIKYKTEELEYLLNQINYGDDSSIREKLTDEIVRIAEDHYIIDDDIDLNIGQSNNRLHINVSNILNDVQDVYSASVRSANMAIDCHSITDMDSCNSMNICRWNNNRCNVCGNKNMLYSVLQIILDDLMNPFGTLRWRILFNVSRRLEDRMITNVDPDSQIIINVSNSDRAIHMLDHYIKTAQSQVADNVRIASLLTNNYTDLQLRVVDRRLQNLKNRINPMNLYYVSLNGMIDSFVIHFDPYDFWYSAMIFSDHVFDTIDTFREQLGKAGQLTDIEMDDFMAQKTPTINDVFYLAKAPWNTHSIIVINTFWEPSIYKSWDKIARRYEIINVFDSHPDDPNAYVVMVAWNSTGTNSMYKLLIRNSRNPLFNKNSLFKNAMNAPNIPIEEI